MQHYGTAPAVAAPGLDLFAAAWVERFVGHGGSFTISPDGAGHLFCRASASDVPGYEPPPSEWPDELKQRRAAFDDAMFTGRTRELMELLEMIPGGAEAVKAHVRAFPSFAYADGTKGIS